MLSSDDGPGLLSVAHWVDVANELLLLLPALPLLLAILWAGAALDRRAEPNETPPAAASWLGCADEWRFVQLMVLSCLLYLVLFEPAIGMVRDWDLFAMTTLSLVPLALLAINRLMRHISSPSEAATFASPAIVLTMVLTCAWIGVNASAERSTARFESMFAYDTVHAPYAYENLATYYYLHDDLPRAIDQLEAAAEISHNPRQYFALAMYYDESGDAKRALELFAEVLRRRPDYIDARLVWATILAREGMNEELEAVARAGTVQSPGQAAFWFLLGQALNGLGRTDESLAALRTCLASNPGPELKARAEALLRLHAPPDQ